MLSYNKYDCLSRERIVSLDCRQKDENVYKSGPLFLSSKGIGWTSWKKRWFILTQTSLVFFRSDPNSVPEKGSEANLTLGGIDLNSSGSVIVKADKKLLTVQFPDGRDGRSFTLKAETSEDLYEWKAALEEALANAPSAGTGQTGVVKNEKDDTADESQEQSKDQASSPKSIVLGRPVLLALEDIDGTPSFLEKALRYVEDHGVNVEGILRQAADVEAVERRIREYEQGKVDFTAEEDGHVIGDCIKYVLRELPSSPIPASCCAALLKAYRSDRATRLSAMRTAICDTFPEPNRRLLQRILTTMDIVAENKAVNRMSVSAVAACMAPLLLRPLLAGEVDLGSEYSMGGDGSVQLMQAAAAANHAQAIVITLLEEYDSIFGEEGDVLSDLYSDSDESGSGSEEYSDYEIYDDDEDEEGESSTEGSQAGEDSEHASSSSGGESGDNGDSSDNHSKGSGNASSNSISHGKADNQKTTEKKSSRYTGTNQSNDHPTKQTSEHVEHSKNDGESDHMQRSSTIANGPARQTKQPSSMKRTGGSKNLSMENINVVTDEEAEVYRLETIKSDLIEKIEEEVKQNAILKEDLLGKKSVLEERRLALRQDVVRLQEQLQREKEVKKALEGGLMMSKSVSPLPTFIDEKTKANLEDIARTEAEVISLQQKADDLGIQINHPHGDYQPPLSPTQGKVKDKGMNREASRKNKDLARKESSMNKSLSSVKRSNSSGEAANTSSALSKLSNRLNFLKERRNQIASELQNIDKDRGKGQTSQNNGQSGSDNQNPRASDDGSSQHTNSFNKHDNQSHDAPAEARR